MGTSDLFVGFDDYDDFDISGDGLDEYDPMLEVGRRRLGRRILRGIFAPGSNIRARRRARRHAAALTARRNALLSASRTKGYTLRNGIKPSSQRVRTQGFGSITLAQGATGVLSSVVEKPIQGRRLTIVPSAPGVILLDVRVGVDSQFTSVNGVPVEMFGPAATTSALEMDPAKTGQTLSLLLQNGAGTPGDIFVSAGINGIASD